MSYNKPDISGNLHTVNIGALIEIKTANYTILESDNGKVFGGGADNIVFTLPPTRNGLQYRFYHNLANGGAKIYISPNAADGIFGTLTLAASVVVMPGTDDTDLVLTKASAIKGDWVELTADGLTGWIITGSAGIWASA